MIENSAGWRYVQSTDSPADYPTVSEHNAGKFQNLKSQVDGKALLSHTHTTSQVTGLDTALAGKAPLATLNTRVPENLALRLDTSVGTRIFAGATMIYGDTGWRDIRSLLVNGWTADIFQIRRVNSTVFLLHRGFTYSQATADKVLALPLGFVDPRSMIPLHGYNEVRLNLVNTSREVEITSRNFTITTYGTTPSLWPVSVSWPTSLPGIPA